MSEEWTPRFHRVNPEPKRSVTPRGASVDEWATDGRPEIRDGKGLPKVRNVLGVSHEKDAVFFGEREVLLWVADHLPADPSNRNDEKTPVPTRFERADRPADERRLAIHLELFDLEAKHAELVFEPR